MKRDCVCIFLDTMASARIHGRIRMQWSVPTKLAVALVVGFLLGLVVGLTADSISSAVRTAVSRFGNTTVLPAEAAASLAAVLANDECERIFGKRPFTSDMYPVRYAAGRYGWGFHNPASRTGYSAEVSFDRDGNDRAVQVYCHVDYIEGI
jgi:hypothetical protein